MDIKTQSKTNVICVLPSRNESWILPHFFECASLWADFIILGDHLSVDDTASVAQRYEKVRLVPLHDTGIDRGLRRKILLEEARRIPGERLIFSIDADEMLSANSLASREWELMLNAQPGTRFRLDWLEVLPGLHKAALSQKLIAFKDDGTPYVGTTKHEPPIPATSGEIVHLREIKLLHYILIEPERMFSKHRWNKCFEIVELGKRPWSMCIMYQDRKIKHYDSPIISVRDEWVNGYEWLEEYRGNRDPISKSYWYDEQVLDYFDKYGIDRFRKLNIWDVDWNQKAQLLGRGGNYGDPRSVAEIWMHKFIERHREELKMKRRFKWKAIDKIAKTVLRLVGW